MIFLVRVLRSHMHRGRVFSPKTIEVLDGSVPFVFNLGRSSATSVWEALLLCGDYSHAIILGGLGKVI